MKLATDTGVPLDAIKDLLDRFVRTGQPITHVKLKIVSKPKKFINFEILKQVFISIFLIVIVSFFTRNFLTEGYLVGWDSMTHVFKTWFTMEWLSGRASFDWCEYWYQGSPIMPMYGPLFYVLSGLLGRISGFDALAASKWVVFLSFPASSLSFYFSTRRKNFEMASVAGAVLYGLIPWHLTYITILGNPTYSLSYLFVPPLFKFVKEKKPFSLIYASISFCLIMLSHQGTGFLFAYALIWYGLFSGLISYKFKKSLDPIIKVGLLSIGLLSFFWIPYVYHSTKTSSFKVPFAPGHENVLQLFNKSHFMYLGIPLFILLLLLIVIIAKSRSREGILYSLMTGVSLLLTFGYMFPLIKLIYPFSRIIGPGYRFNVLSSFTIAMLATEAIKEVSTLFARARRSHYQKLLFFTLPLVVTTIFLSVITVLPLAQFYNMPIPQSHNSIYANIADQTLDGRVWWVPRGALQASIPMFTGRPTPDGWYDQAASPETYELIHELADLKLIVDPEYFVEQLTDLSVRFLVVPKGSIYDSLKGLNGLLLISEYPDLALFQVENINPVEINPPPPMARALRWIGVLFSVLFIGCIILSIKYIFKREEDFDMSLARAKRGVLSFFPKFWLPLLLSSVFVISLIFTVHGELFYWPFERQLYVGVFLGGTFLLLLSSRMDSRFRVLKKLLPYLVSLGCTALAVNVLFVDKIMWTHDTTINSLPFMAFYKDLVYKSGSLPRWLHYTWMGVPCLRFYSPLIYWVSLLFPFLEAIATLKLMIVVSFFLSALFMFYTTKEIYDSNLAASISALIYTLNGYHLLDALIRGAIPETFNFIWFPLSLLFFWRITKGRKITSSIILGGITFALILLTHFLTAYLFAFFLGVYVFVVYLSSKRTWILKCFLAMMLLGISLSAWFTVPFFAENRLARMASMPIAVHSPVTRTHFVTLGQIFIRRIWEFPNGSPAWSVYFGNVIMFLTFISIVVGHSKKFNQIQGRLIPLILFAIGIIIYNTPFGRSASNLLHFYPLSIFIEALQFSVRTFTILALIAGVLSGVAVAEGCKLMESYFEESKIRIPMGELFVLLAVGLIMLDALPFTGVMLWEPGFQPEEGAIYIFGKLKNEEEPFRVWSPMGPPPVFMGPPTILINHYTDRLFDTPYLDWILLVNKLVDEPDRELYTGTPPKIAGYLSLKYIIARQPLYTHFLNESLFKVVDSYTSEKGLTTVLLENLLFRPFFEVSDDLRDLNSGTIPSEITEIKLKDSLIELNLKTDVAGHDPRYLTVKESYYPGWVAYLNGSQAKVVPTENGLMAVEIPKGVLHVRLIFKRTFAENVGIIVTILGTSGVVLWLIFILKQKYFEIKEINHMRVVSDTNGE